jgi:hypothetical protein
LLKKKAQLVKRLWKALHDMNFEISVSNVVLEVLALLPHILDLYPSPKNHHRREKLSQREGRRECNKKLSNAILLIYLKRSLNRELRVFQYMRKETLQ